MRNDSQLFGSLHVQKAEYFYRWYWDRPMVVTQKRNEELRKIQQILVKCLRFYAEHYLEYSDMIPLENRVLDILERQSQTEYRLGTFRPDYVISDKGEIKVCEITSRFFGNGYFVSWFADHKGRELAEKSGVAVSDANMEKMLRYLAERADGYERICVLKSADKSDSIPLYVPFYTALGKEVTVLEESEIVSKEEKLNGAFLLSALNQKDILALPDRIIDKMIASGFYNDFRTVFLAHDKRLFSLFFSDAFTSRFLKKEETAFLRSRMIETAVFGQKPELWEDARKNKDNYIVKHHCLGKSEKVFAGKLTDVDTWEALFSSGEIRDMILQPFVSQRVTDNVWEENLYQEYTCGTILCVDDEYFGTGLFRSSSLPVLNQGDDRKVSYVLTDDVEGFGGACVVL